MKIPIKPLCEGKRVREDGSAVLYFQWFHDGVHRIFLNTGIAIPPKFWNNKFEAVNVLLDAGCYTVARIAELVGVTVSYVEEVKEIRSGHQK